MKHALRKYLSPCGSALFMVVSTMAALIVLVTAMYMSVVTSGQVQFATFDQEQAYVTSTSVSDIITAYISNSSNSKTSTMAKINSLKVGESISTNGNDFISLSPTGTKEDSNIGAYDVDITRINDETVSGSTCQVYDIAVTVKNNGIIETTHMFIRSTPGEPTQMEVIDRFFTNTGYLPNDVWISSVTTDSTLYCDNEYTVFSKDRFAGTFGGDGDIILNMDIVCAGAALFNDQTTLKAADKPLTWVFGNTLTISSSCTMSNFDLSGTSSEHGRIMVGGDLVLEGNRTFPAYTDVYVMGNLYIKGYMKFDGKLCVGKDIIFMYEKNPWGDGGKDWWSSASDMYVNGNITAEPGTEVRFNPGENKGSWADDYAKIGEDIDARIGGSVFPKWQAETSGLPTEDIIFQSYDSAGEGVVGKYVHYIGEDCVIGKVRDSYDGTGASANLTVIIDTGDDPKGVRTLSVSPNCDSVGVSNTFMWYPEASPSGGKTITVLTVGRGTLVIDVPDGITYQASDQEFFGDLSWFMMAGGSIETTDSGAVYFSRNGSLSPNSSSVIHNNGLILEQADGTCKYKKIDGSDYYTCESHGGSYEEYNVKKVEDGQRDTLCEGRILKNKVDDFFATSAGARARSEIGDYYDSYFGPTLNGTSGYSTECYYPTVNIFVISVLENADIQFGCKKADNTSIMENVYFGYVYAPYMSYISIGSGGGLKTVGGIVVSDMALSGSYEYIFAQPERSISQISGEDLESLTPSGSRTWRVHGY